MADTTTSSGPADVGASAEAAFAELGDVDISLASEEDIGVSPEPGPSADDVSFEDDAPEGEEEDGLGSKEQPYSVKTLPESYVTLKVDGEERVVSVREMTDGYMRQEAFHKRMNQVASLVDQAKQAGNQFKAEKEEFRSSFHGLMNSPDELFSFMDEHVPEVLDQVARKAMQRVIEWNKDPRARAQHEWAKQQAKIERDKAAFEAERNAYQRTKQDQEAHVKYLGEFKPGYDAGMKRAGYPAVSDEFRETVKGIVMARRASTGKITAKDVEEAVVRTAKALGAASVEDRRPAPAKQPVVQQRRPLAAKSGKPAEQSFSQMWRNLGK